MLVAHWFTASLLTHTQTHTSYRNTLGPQAGERELPIQSPFLLCWKEGKTVVRLGGFSAHVERLIGDYYSVDWAWPEQGSSCWTGSHLRHGPVPPATLLAAWWAVGKGRKVKTDTDKTKSPDSRKLPVCSGCECVNAKKRTGVGELDAWEEGRKCFKIDYFSGGINSVKVLGTCGGRIMTLQGGI